MLLYYIKSYFIKLYYIELHYIKLHYIKLYYIFLHDMIPNKKYTHIVIIFSYCHYYFCYH